MSVTEQFDESDGSLDAAVAKITAKMGAGEREDTRSNNRGDINEYDGSTDLEELEAQAADAAAQPKTQAKSAKAEKSDAKETNAATEGADAADDGEEQFLELPPETEDGEPERVPLKEALAAIKAQRQIQGDTASVINAAEAKYQQEQDAVLTSIAEIHDVVLANAQAALRLMPRPQMPSESLLDENSQYFNPQAYHVQKLNYDKQVAVLTKLVAERDKAKTDGEAIKTLAQQQQDVREHERLGRLKGWEDWKDPVKREARATAMMTEAEKQFGIPRDLMDKYPFHHGIMQLVQTALDAKRAPAREAEVKKQVQEKVAKIVNGRASDAPRDSTGRFVSEARTRLKETGSEDAFAEMLMKSGALKQLVR